MEDSTIGSASDEYFHVAKILWEFQTLFEEVEPSEVLICLGSYDPRVADRAAALFEQCSAERILVTGKHGRWTKDRYQDTEAERFAAIIIQHGVPESKILLENNATNLGENIKFSRNLLCDLGGSSVLFVTKPQTQLRLKLTIRKQWPEISSIVTAPLIAFEDYPNQNITRSALVTEMLGDVERILRYPQLGFQVSHPIPAKVMETYEYLRRRPEFSERLLAS